MEPLAAVFARLAGTRSTHDKPARMSECERTAPRARHASGLDGSGSGARWADHGRAPIVARGVDCLVYVITRDNMRAWQAVALHADSLQRTDSADDFKGRERTTHRIEAGNTDARRVGPLFLFFLLVPELARVHLFFLSLAEHFFSSGFSGAPTKQKKNNTLKTHTRTVSRLMIHAARSATLIKTRGAPPAPHGIASESRAVTA
jgi:hypothetical protein